MDDRRATDAEAPLLGARYRLGALLGRGGAGRVYEAVDTILGRPVAVKVFQAGGDPVGRSRFAAEARLLAGLSHPGLVTVYDVSLDNDEPFLVMRLVNGPTLRDLLDRGPYEPAAVARTGARLADALAYVHAHDIVHRDIKPSNVLVDESGDCHLTDFGVARALSSAHLTVSGEFVGTAAYLAPEQITDIDVGPSADIYALGLLLLEGLTGHTEYTGTTVEAALARLNRPPRIPDTLPPPWHTLLTAMTARDPGARPDAARCAELLSAIADGRTGALHAPPPIPAPRGALELPSPPATKGRTRSLPRPRPVHAGITALALAAACAVVIGMTSTDPGVPTSEPRPQAPTTTTSTGTGVASPPTSPPVTQPVTQPVTAAPPPPAHVAVPPAVNHQGSPPAAGQPVAAGNDNAGTGGGGKKNKGPGKGKNKGKG